MDYPANQEQNQPVSFKFCTHCGNKMQKESKFCPACGANSNPDPVNYADYMQPEQQSNSFQQSYGYSNQDAAGQSQNVYVNVQMPQGQAYQNYSESNLSRTVALLLCVFLGWSGAHHFYAGKAGLGILYLLTCGIFGIMPFVDMILIAVGSFSDSTGRPISKW